MRTARLHRLSRTPQAFAFALALRARFHETDAMGVVHHASYLRYLEDARVEYLRSLGHPYAEIRRGGLDFAVVAVHVEYLAPLRFDDVFRVHVRTGQLGRATFALEYLLERDDEPVATARTRHAVLDAASGRAVRAPAWLGPTADVRVG